MVDCDVCEKKLGRFITCDYCKKSQYCSSDCRLLGTRDHKACTPPGSLRSIDYLYINVYENVFPTNEKTLKDYGFSNCKRPEDWTNLLGLYICVLQVIAVPRDVLHDYCMKDEIADIIKKKYDEFPLNLRGAHYPWFLQHQHIVKNGNIVKVGKYPTNLQETSTKSKNKPQPSTKFSIQDGAHIINYGYNGKKSYYYLNLQDPRLAWRSGLAENVEKVTNDIDFSGEGIILQLHTCSSSTIRGHQVSVETLAEFFKRYGIRKAHIEKMKEGKSF